MLPGPEGPEGPSLHLSPVTALQAAETRQEPRLRHGPRSADPPSAQDTVLGEAGEGRGASSGAEQAEQVPVGPRGEETPGIPPLLADRRGSTEAGPGPRAPGQRVCEETRPRESQEQGFEGALPARSRSLPADSERLALYSDSGTRKRRKMFAWANGSEVINPSECRK